MCDSHPKPFGQSPGGHPRFKENEAACPPYKIVKGVAKDVQPCCYCGRPMLRITHSVYMTDGAEFVDPQTVEHGDGLVGYYGVGSDCARKLKAQGVKVYRFGKEFPVPD